MFCTHYKIKYEILIKWNLITFLKTYPYVYTAQFHPVKNVSTLRSIKCKNLEFYVFEIFFDGFNY